MKSKANVHQKLMKSHCFKAEVLKFLIEFQLLDEGNTSKKFLLQFEAKSAKS